MSKKSIRKPVQRGTSKRTRAKKTADAAKGYGASDTMAEKLAGLPDADAETREMTDAAIAGEHASVKESAKLAPALADSALVEGSPAKENVAAAETLADTQKVLDSPSAAAVSSLSSNVAPVTVQTKTSNKEKIMDVTLSLGKVSKSGKKAQYRSAALARAVVLPLALFAGTSFPASVTMSGEFATLGADEQTKAEARNAARVAKGLKPKATPAELFAKETARAAKLQGKLDKANARAAKLAGKVPAPAAAEPVAEPAQA